MFSQCTEHRPVHGENRVRNRYDSRNKGIKLWILIFTKIRLFLLKILRLQYIYWYRTVEKLQMIFSFHTRYRTGSVSAGIEDVLKREEEEFKDERKDS